MIVYVVKRPFKSLGIFHGVGEVLESPDCVKRLKSKIFDGKIFQLNTDVDFKNQVQLLESKLGVSIAPKVNAYVLKNTPAKEPEEVKKEIPSMEQTTAAKTVAAKPTVTKAPIAPKVTPKAISKTQSAK